jgi:hypothetical protein
LHPVRLKPDTTDDVDEASDEVQGYSSQVSNLFGGVAGRLQRLQEEMKK